MKRYAPRWMLAGLFALAAACTGPGPDNPTASSSGQTSNGGVRPRGQSEFETPVGGNSYGATDSNGSNSGGAPAAGTDNSAQRGGEAAPERLIEESDIYKIVGNNLFVLNRYRGLQIIDISNLDAPRVVGRAPIYGYPKDMYVRDNNAYVIVSDYWSYYRNVDAADAMVEPFYGSQLRIIDVSNVQSPTVIGSINLAGDCGDSRIVGSVMYLVSHRYPWWSYYGTNDTEDKTQVLSVDISDPDNIAVVDTEDFPRNGWDHHVYVNTEAIYLSASSYGRYDNNGNWVGGPETVIRYVDISDPNGAITVRGATTVTGMVHDRWAMDVHNDVLRVASGESWGNGDVFLTTLDVANPDQIAALGQTVLHVDEQLKSARFDGNRGYLVSYRNIDPLFAFDLSDPANPTLLGELEMTGWLDFMVPMGDRVVALGHDDVTDSSGSRHISLAVSLIDVGTNQPRLIDRVGIDGAWGWVPSEADDFAKVFKVLPEANLVIFPFQAWDPNTWRYLGGVQLIDYFRDDLVKRGLIENAGWVERGVVHGENTVLTISSEVFQVMNITNRDQPAVRGRLELARNVTDFAIVGDSHTAQLAGDWYRGDTNLTITPIDDPDTASPTSSVHVPAPYGQLFTHENFAYVTSVVQTPATGNTSGSSATQVQVVDLSNPASPAIRGTLTLPEAVWGSYGYWYWGGGDEVVQIGTTLAFHHYAYNYWYGEDCTGCGNYDTAHRIYLVDLANPDQPRLASTIVLDDVSWAWGLRAMGNNTLLLSDYDYVQRGERWYARYNLRPIDISNLSNPAVLSPINIPGWVLGVSDDSAHVYTIEGYWDEPNQRYRSFVHALELFEGHAYLQSSIETEGWLSNILVEGDVAYAVDYRSWQETVDDQVRWRQASNLVTIDLSNPGNIRIAGTAQIPDSWGYLRKVEGGRAFISGNAGIFSYRVDDVNHPVFEQFFRTYGWVQDVVVHGSNAFLPSGYYGVQVLDLTGSL